jgi:hypothetical protein
VRRDRGEGGRGWRVTQLELAEHDGWRAQSAGRVVERR